MSEEQKWLHRGATSLTLMLMGYDHDLDTRLIQLRATLRDSPFDLEAFQDALERTEKIYDSLEGQAGKSIDTYAKTFEVLLEDADNSILDPLRKTEPLLTDLLKIAEPLARQINTLAHVPTVMKTDTDLEAMRGRLVRRFKSLLDTLMMMGDTNGKLGQLTALLEDKPSWKALDELAQKTIELLNTRLAEDKKQFEGYLAALNEKLTRINNIVEADSATLSELKEINLSFNDSINKQMTEARDKIDQHHKVDALKTELMASLDSIAQRLQEYQASYGSKLQSLQQSKVEMNQQIQELEQENLELLTELHKERKLSKLDTLTQLPNRQGFNLRLEEEMSRAARYQQFLSIAILDIDFFKRINDEFGHIIGDKVLRMISKEMKRVCRESDFIARFGGEEFVVLLPQTSLEDAKIAIDKIRKHVENCPFHYQNKPVPLTISGGVAERLPEEAVEDWLDRADAALYQSKRNGRNQVNAAEGS
jgi:diguanylate cyclase